MADTSFTAQQTTILAAWLNQVNLAVFQGRSPNMGTTTGSANAQVLTLATGSLYTGRTAGDTFGFVAGYSNSSAATLQIVAPSGSLAAAALELNGAALTGGEVIAGQPYVVSWDGTAWQLISLAGTAYGTTLLQAVSAGAARTVLDAAQFTASLAEDTTPDKIADFFHGYDTSASAEKKLRIITATARAMPFGQGLLINGKIVASVGSNALTVAVKGDNDSDPSSTNPVYALFRKATLTDSGFDIVSITSALSVVVSSGSTLGHASAIAQYVFVYLINNSGTAELAVSNLPPDYPGVFGKARLVSTTAEGGAGGADSATGVYSTTARSNVPWICVAKMLSTQATAGTWASSMTQVDQAPFTIPTCAFRATGISSQSFADNTFAKQTMSTEHYDSDSTYDSTTNYRHQPNVAGLYRYRTGVACSLASSYYVLCALFRNGSEYTREQMTPPAGFQILQHGDCVFMNGTTDYMEAYAYQNSGGTINLDNSYSPFTGERIPQ